MISVGQVAGVTCDFDALAHQSGHVDLLARRTQEELLHEVLKDLLLRVEDYGVVPQVPCLVQQPAAVLTIFKREDELARTAFARSHDFKIALLRVEGLRRARTGCSTRNGDD